MASWWTGPAIRDVLSWHDLAMFTEKLEKAGVFCLYDMNWIREEDLLEAGMNKVQARKFLYACWHYWFGHIDGAVPPPVSEDLSEDAEVETVESVGDSGDSGDSGDKTMEELMAQVRQHAQEKQTEAISLLNTCISLSDLHCAEMSHNSATDALNRIRKPGSTNAMLAFNATLRGRSACKGELKKHFDKAIKSVRDFVVFRVQLAVTWANRDAFVAELERAHGGPMDRNSSMFAAFMHSHSKVICEPFPCAFLSNCKIRRREPRDKKKRRDGSDDATQTNPSSSSSSSEVDWALHNEPGANFL